MSLHAGGVVPHGERQGALLGRHGPPVGPHLQSRPPEHRPITVQGKTQLGRCCTARMFKFDRMLYAICILLSAHKERLEFLSKMFVPIHFV